MDIKKFYKKIQEGRNWYFVEYTPSTGATYAGLTLTIMNEGVDKRDIIQAMEKELKEWLNRYPVPIFVSAWDSEDNQFSFDELNKSKNLIGFFDENEKIYMSWDTNAKKSPDTALEKEYLDTVYSNVESVSVVQHAESRKVKNKQIEQGRNLLFILVFITFLWTLLFDVILQYNTIVALLTSWYIIFKACKEIFEYMGVWPFKPKREKEKENEERLKDQFYYFYKHNPEGFESFKRESLDRMIKENNVKTASELKMK